MISEFTKVADLIDQGVPVDDIDAKLLGREKRETTRRQFRELKLRVETLTSEQIEILANGSLDEQKQIIHIALCKTYAIYKDFVTDVLAEKAQVYDFNLTDLDYNSFISRKVLDHYELDRLAPSTKKKVKQVLYKMLNQVGIIDSTSNPTILPPNVESKVEQAIINEDPTLLSCFLYTEHQINALL